MGLTRLLRKSAALPLHAAEAAANTTAALVTGSVRFAGTSAATVVGGGVALATAPVSGNSSVERRFGGVHAEPAGPGSKSAVWTILRAEAPSRTQYYPRLAHIQG